MTLVWVRLRHCQFGRLFICSSIWPIWLDNWPQIAVQLWGLFASYLRHCIWILNLYRQRQSLHWTILSLTVSQMQLSSAALAKKFFRFFQSDLWSELLLFIYWKISRFLMGAIESISQCTFAKFC